MTPSFRDSLPPLPSPRLAVVQHGDYPEALALRASGAPEPYFAMYYSLACLQHLAANLPHLVLSLNAPAHRRHQGPALFVGLPAPHPVRGLPQSVTELLWARRIVREVAAFRPTHLLIRTGGLLAVSLLRYAARRNLPALVIFASVLNRHGLVNSLVARSLVKLLNRPNVQLIGNHKQPATDTLLAAGLNPEKTVAWDWPAARRPEDFPPKSLAPSDPASPHRLLYVGNLIAAKGIPDLIAAVQLLARENGPVHLTLVGAGPDEPALRAAASSTPKHIAFTGRLPNAEVFSRMRAATLVCVPSRHEFTEGMPLSLTEALASRTPVLASDHPVFTAAFRDDEGLRFFPAANPAALAATIQTTLADPAAYAALSESTAAAFARVHCPTTFADLLTLWQSLAGLSAAPVPPTPRPVPVAAATK